MKRTTREIFIEIETIRVTRKCRVRKTASPAEEEIFQRKDAEAQRRQEFLLKSLRLCASASLR